MEPPADAPGPDASIGAVSQATTINYTWCAIEWVNDIAVWTLEGRDGLPEPPCLPSTCTEVAHVAPDAPLDITFFVANDLHFMRGWPYEVHAKLVDAMNRADEIWPGGWPAGSRDPGKPFGSPLGVIIAGDISTVSTDAWMAGFFRELVEFRDLYEQGRTAESIRFPVFPGLGNHDYYGPDQYDYNPLTGTSTTEKSEIWLKYLDKRVGQGCNGITGFDPVSRNYSWNWGGVHFVQGNVWAGRVNGLNWLKNDLETHVGSSGRPVVLIQHYGWDAGSTYGFSDENRRELKDVLKPYNVAAIFTGHIHNEQIFQAWDAPARGPDFDVYRGSSGGESGWGGFLAVRMTSTSIDVAHLGFHPKADGTIEFDALPSPLVGNRLIRTPYALPNLALGKPATQSSNYTPQHGLASLAVDGNPDGRYWAGSTTHTSSGTDNDPAWWQVDLGSYQPIGDVVIFNRTDCCAERLNNFRVMLSYDGVTWLDGATYWGVAPERLQLSINDRARYVRIELMGEGYLSLAEVEVLPPNLARSAPATQSSVASGRGPQRAVDGDLDGNPAHGSVTETMPEDRPWWQVDLLQIEPVGTVVLYNRDGACCLNNFTLEVSTDGVTWHMYQYLQTAPARLPIMVNRSARYIRVRLNGTGTLSLAEVQVFPRMDSLTRGTAPQQSSTWGGGVARLAVDGNTDGVYHHGSVSHTNSEVEPWWKVDLGAVHSIAEVYVYNRTDLCCSSRLNDFYLEHSLDGVTWTELQQPGPAGARTRIVVNDIARFVRISLDGADRVLSLAEVQIFAGERFNMALGKTATQTSNYDPQSGQASLAVDGNTDGDYTHGSVSHTGLEFQPYWTVDLGRVLPVGTVALFKRTDCCDRLMNVVVGVSQDGNFWSWPVRMQSDQEQARFFPKQKARYVRVLQTKHNEYLNLAEVQVFPFTP